jgi:hypothetical protein
MILAATITSSDLLLMLSALYCCAGRLHFFFPDSRLALDLNTDKTLKVDLTLLIHISMLQ